VYKAASEGVMNLADKFFEMERAQALQVLVTSAKNIPWMDGVSVRCVMPARHLPLEDCWHAALHVCMCACVLDQYCLITFGRANRNLAFVYTGACSQLTFAIISHVVFCCCLQLFQLVSVAA
jgi:hypothetical protein